MLKIAIIGCGQIADAHVQEIRKIDNAHIIAVCDLEKLMAEQLAERYGIPHYYDNLQELLSETNPDVVHITTPPQTHYTLAKTSLTHGCHVYVEKPFTLNIEEAKELIDLAESQNKRLTVGHIYFFDPPALALRELIKDGVLGEPVHIESFYGYNLKGSFGSAILGNKDHWVHHLPGKLFHNNIDHMINKITEFLPDEEPEIIVRAYRSRDEVYGDHRDEMLDELRVMFIGEKISAYGTFSSKAKPTGHFLRIYGTKNTLHVDFLSRTVLIERPTDLPGPFGRLHLTFDRGIQYFKECGRHIIKFIKSDFHFMAGMNKLITLFYQSIINDTPPPIKYSEIIRIMSFMEEIFRQINQKKSEIRISKF